MKRQEIVSGWLPALDADTVTFESLSEFRRHYHAYVRHGALLVASAPLDVMSRHRLTLRIVELDVTYGLHAVVLFRAQGTVGFSIEGFYDHRTGLQSILEDLEPRTSDEEPSL